MYSRKRFDIGWLDLAAGLVACVGRPSAQEEARRARAAELALAPDGAALACLSVRSGLDLYLGALRLPAGSEVLVSALTIPDMWKVLEAHGLVPVPVDLEPASLAPSFEAARRAITPRTRAILVAHLFGTELDLAPWAALAHENGWLLWEDCAQSFARRERAPSAGADLSLFSFGPIKTQTALAGGVLVVRDAAVLARMRSAQAAWPRASTGTFAKRVAKYAGLKLLTTRPAYAAFVALCRARGADHDELVRKSARGFPGADLLAQIRHRPSPALLALLERRLVGFEPRGVERRARLGDELARALPSAAQVPGCAARAHTYWVFPVLVDEPELVVEALRADGFDATRHATLRAVPAPPGRPELEPRVARELLERMVYLPLYPELGRRGLRRLLASLERALGAPRERLRTAVLTPQVAAHAPRASASTSPLASEVGASAALAERASTR